MPLIVSQSKEPLGSGNNQLSHLPTWVSRLVLFSPSGKVPDEQLQRAVAQDLTSAPTMTGIEVAAIETDPEEEGMLGVRIRVHSPDKDAAIRRAASELAGSILKTGIEVEDFVVTTAVVASPTESHIATNLVDPASAAISEVSRAHHTLGALLDP